MRLFGTDELVPPATKLTAGRLGASLENGNIRYVTWDGTEVLRAIAFIVRDTNWGTYAPQLDDLVIEQVADGFVVTYVGRCASVEGDFTYSARIEGTASGRLAFSASGQSQAGFKTNRTGFVVLHGLDGVVGRPVEVEHASGRRSMTRFPELVQGAQPIMDIRALSHEPLPGLSVTVRMEGDAFEMEDHRNWSDASFKTYVRPLARGYPYAIAAAEPVEQSITLTVSGTANGQRRGETTPYCVTLGEILGTMPEIGLAVLPDENPSGALALRPSYIVARIDTRSPWNTDHLTRLGRVPFDLDIIIRGKSPAAELAPVAEALRSAGLAPRGIMIVPECDLRRHPDSGLPPEEPGYDRIFPAVRAAFPGTRIGGGMLAGFAELNRSRPPQPIDFVAHSTQAIVHAADDVSVMETLEALPDVVRTTRSFAGDTFYRLGPATIGAPAAFYSATPAPNPQHIRMPTADDDPRQRALFAAAFAVGYVAVASACGVEAVTLAADAASLEADRHPLPLTAVIAGLARIAGKPRVDVSLTGRGIAGLAVRDGDAVEIWLANLTGGVLDVIVENITEAWIVDAEMAGRISGGVPTPQRHTGRIIRLDAYAVACLRVTKHDDAPLVAPADRRAA
jgi:hypothetical protein